MEDFDQLDHYALLGVERSANADELKRAYRQQITRYHPDRFANAASDEQAYASRRALHINEAYRVLSDFQARLAYTRGLSSGSARTARPQATPVTPPPPRDHLAELYDQAQAHLADGRKLQAAAVLRELLTLNPFYRDATTLLAQAESRAVPPPAPPRPAVANRSRRALIAGGAGGLFLVALGAIGVLLRRSPSTVASGPPPTSETAASPAPTTAPAGVAAGTSTPTIDPTNALPTAAPPTATLPAPTSTPTASPTAAPTNSPTTEPTATPIPPSPTPEPLAEAGSLLLSDTFVSTGSGWPTITSGAWSVGYDSSSYRITTQAGLGNIWVYRTLPSNNAVLIGVDVAVTGGAAGMLLRFNDAGNYLAYILDPATGDVRLEERVAGQSRNLLSVRSDAVQTSGAARNRLVAVQRANTLELRVNGQLIDTLTVNAPPVSGRYGLVAVSGANPVEARFFDLTIRDAR